MFAIHSTLDQRATMTIDEILEAFAEAEEYQVPREAIQAAVAQQEEITPHLISQLDATLEQYKARTLMTQGNWRVPNFAMTLLASFGEAAAHQRIVRLLRMNEQHLDYVWADSLTEDGARLLASTYPSDPKPMQSLVEDEQSYEFARSQGLLGLYAVVQHSMLAEETFIGYLTALFRGQIPRKPSEVWDEMVRVAGDMKCVHLLRDIEQAYDEGLCEMTSPSEIDVIVRVLNGNPPDVWFPHDVKLVHDAEAEIAAWPYFTRREWHPKPLAKLKIGRNDPCPCGSGKKYKKCCGVGK